MAGCIVRQLLFCTFVYTCYTSHYNKRLLTYLLYLVFQLTSEVWKRVMGHAVRKPDVTAFAQFDQCLCF